jgi:alpha-ketoglutarate-dependent taurine dioxygenase
MAQFELRDLSPAFGSEVVGFVPAELDDEGAKVLRDASDDRGLLVFRGIEIDRPTQTSLIDRLIGYDRPANDPMAARGEMLVSNREPEAYAPYGRLMFHSDMMWHPEPFQVLSLYGVEVEEPAVGTQFASTANAWDTLPADLKARVKDLHAEHVTGQVYSRGGDELLVPERETPVKTVMPLAYVHPRTGRTLLYVSQQMTARIVEIDDPEASEALLQELFAHLYGEANSLEHSWRSGDLVAWDNLAVQHARGPVLKDGPARTLRKVISPIPAIAGSAERPKFAST